MGWVLGLSCESVGAVYLDVICVFDVCCDFVCGDVSVYVVYENVSVCVSCWFYCFADGGVVEVVLESGVDEKIGVLFCGECEDVSCLVFGSSEMRDVFVIFVAGEVLVEEVIVLFWLVAVFDVAKKFEVLFVWFRY